MFVTKQFETHEALGADHDNGLDHPHDWARERAGRRWQGPVVANAAAAPTPSSTTHDDNLYAAS